MMRLPVRIQALCLAVLVLGGYSFTINAPFNPVDDRALVQWLYNMEGTGFLELFSWKTGNYYRPVLQASYLFDMHFWGAAPSSMHLENVLLHIFNTLLLFACARLVFKCFDSTSQWPPLLAALFFAFHPVNTEAVNWIAGRSDLLACFFVLLATWLLLFALINRRPLYACLSLLPLVPGVFSKETAVFFVPAALCIIYCDNITSNSIREPIRQRIKSRLPYFLPYISLPVFYLLFRVVFLSSWDTGGGLLRQFFYSSEKSFVENVHTAVTGLGFYVKKLFFPWPLNFTIFQVSENFFWVGLLLLFVLIYFALRKGLVGGFFLASFCLGLSAILAMLLRPAWTPVAERYLYLPSVFFSLGMVLCVVRLLPGATYRKVVVIAVVVLFSGTAYATIQRNLVWQDNIALFEDAVAKSPEFPFARSVLADLLIEAGRVEEGRAMIRSNTAPDGLRNADFLDLKRAKLLFDEEQYVSRETTDN